MRRNVHVKVERTAHNAFQPQNFGAAAGDEKGIAKVMYTGWILYAAMFALAAFLSTYALQSGISAFVAAFPVV